VNVPVVSIDNPESDSAEDDESSSSDGDDSIPFNCSPEMRWVYEAERQAKTERRQRRERRKARAGVGGGTPTLTAFYTLGHLIGEGTYGIVRECTHLPTKEVRAVKTVSKNRVPDREQLMNEINILKLLNHPNIVCLFDTFESAKEVHTVLELCSGGELYHKLRESCLGFDEAVAMQFLCQMVSAVEHLHNSFISHRDVKPENCLLVTKYEDLRYAKLKLSDFGFARKFERGQPMQTQVFSACYAAPEVFSRAYTEACDLWSLGVAAYFFLSGELPFTGATEAEILEKVRLRSYNFSPRWNSISEVAKQFVSHLLVDAAVRPTATELAQHRWLKHLS